MRTYTSRPENSRLSIKPKPHHQPISSILKLAKSRFVRRFRRELPWFHSSQSYRPVFEFGALDAGDRRSLQSWEYKKGRHWHGIWISKSVHSPPPSSVFTYPISLLKSVTQVYHPLLLSESTLTSLQLKTYSSTVTFLVRIAVSENLTLWQPFLFVWWQWCVWCALKWRRREQIHCSGS